MELLESSIHHMYSLRGMLTSSLESTTERCEDWIENVHSDVTNLVSRGHSLPHPTHDQFQLEAWKRTKTREGNLEGAVGVKWCGPNRRT